MKLSDFLVIGLILWAVDYVLHPIVPMAAPIIPPFLIVWSVMSDDMGQWALPVALFSLFSDFFSGFFFGAGTLALLGVYGTIYVIRRIVVLDARSQTSICVASVLCALASSFLVVFLTGGYYIHGHILFWLLQSAVVVFAVYIWIKIAGRERHLYASR